MSARWLSLFTLLLFGGPAAFAGNSGVTYQGRILRPDGSPLSGATTQFKLQIRTPDSNNCLMYEELQTLDLRNTSGQFSLTINDGTGSRTDTTSLNLDRIFANRGTFTFDPSTCSAGSAYTPNQSDGRSFVVLFKDETMASWEPIPAQKINYVPFAFDTKQISGFPADSLLRVVDGSGDPLTGVSPLSNAQYTALLDLLNGSSAAYTKAGQLNGVALPTMTSGEVLGWNGSAWVSQAASGGPNSVTTTMIQSGAVDGTKLDPAISISTSGMIASAVTTTRDFKIYAASPSTFYVGMLADPTMTASYTLTWPVAVASTNGQVLTSDTSGKLTWTTPSSAGITALTGDVTATGPGSAAATVVSVGGSAAADINTAELAANAATSLNTPNTIVKRDSAGNFAAGTVTAASVDSTGVVSAGSLSSSSTITATSGISGASIAVTGAISGASVTATGAVTGASVKTGSLQLDNGVSLIELVNPPLSAAYTLTLPGGTGTTGQVLTTNGSGVTSWTSPLSSSTAFVQGGNTFGANADLGTNDGFDLNLRTGGTTKMTVTSGGNVGIGTTSPGYKLDVAGDVNVTGGFKVNGIDIATGGGDFLKNGSVAMTGPLKLANGTEALPALSFASDTDSGMYRDSDNVIGFSTGGENRVYIQDAGLVINTGYSDGLRVNSGSANYGLVQVSASWGQPGAIQFADGQSSWAWDTAISRPSAGKILIDDNNGGGSATLEVKGTMSIAGTASGAVKFTAPAAAGSATYTWPSSAPASNMVLQSDATGALSWVSVTDTLSGLSCSGGQVPSWSGSAWACVSTSTSNSNNALVLRDGSGGFSAGAISATSVTSTGAVTAGSVVYKDSSSSTVTVSAPTTVSSSYVLKWPTSAGGSDEILKTDASGNLSWASLPTALPPNGAAGGDLSGTYPDPSIATVGTSTAANIHSAEVLANAATAANTVNAIVKRDGSGNFTASDITASNVQTDVLKLNNAGSILNIVNPIGGAWTMTLPQTAGSGGQVLTTDGAGLMSWTNALTSTTGFVQGGNTFGANADLGTNDGFDLNLRTGGTTKMTVTSGGNVGIGTTSPTWPLDVSGRGRFANSSNGVAQSLILLNGSSGVDYASSIDFQTGSNVTQSKIVGAQENVGATNGYLALQTRSSGTLTEAMRITSSGNVGIGTTDPSGILHMSAAGNAYSILESTTAGAHYRTYYPVGGTGGMFFYAGSILRGAVYGDTDHSVILKTQNASPLRLLTGNIERVRIDSVGNVGIGTTIPDLMAGYVAAQRVLGISGDGSASASSHGMLYLGNNRAVATVGDETGALRFISRANNGERTAGAIENILEGSGGINGFGSYMMFKTKGDNGFNTERVRISSSGNVGIGTTSPAYKLDVAGDVNVTGNFKVNGTTISTGGGDFKKDGTVSMTGAFKAANGTVTAPGISFASDTNTGFYAGGGDDITMTLGGIDAIQFANYGISSFRPFSASNGTVSQPDFELSGNSSSGTGFYSPATNNIGFATNGSERMRITPTGNVGIGTTAPETALTVKQTSAATAPATGIGLWSTLPMVYKEFNYSPSSAPTTNSVTADSAYMSVTGSNFTNGVARAYNARANWSGSAMPNTVSGVYGEGYMTGTSTGGGSVSGLDGFATLLSSGSLTASTGVSGSGYNQSPTGGTVGVVKGGAFAAVQQSGNTNELIGVSGSSNIVSGQSVNLRATGVYATVSNLGTVPLSYGVYIDSVQGTKAFSLYASDAGAPSYFAGNVGIGTTSPGAKLEVAGTIASTSGGVRYPDGTTQTTSAVTILHGSATSSFLAGLTRYIGFGFADIGTTESGRQLPLPMAGTLSKFYLNTNSAQGSGGNLVCTIRKNGVDTSLFVTIPANGAAGLFSDTSHSVSVAEGDLIGIRCVNAASADSATITAFSAVYRY